jgi:hypothetical protein
MLPFTCGVGVPEMVLPGCRETSPLTMVVPLLVMVTVARMPRLTVVPSARGVWLSAAPVVKVHGFATSPAARALPARSLAPLTWAV